MANINAGLPQSFENASVLTLTDGATVHALLNIEPGTADFLNAGYSSLPYEVDIDRGVLPTDRRQGPQVVGTFKCTASLTAGAFADADLEKIISAAHANGIAKKYTLGIDVPDYRGSTGGKRVVAINATFDGPFSMKEGGEGLTVPIEMTFPHAATVTEEATL